ncbi:MAG: hypothetical protein FWG65_07190 [Turicibacter sp.]|nr:hypothetical protein [Turicibacter sp.]
MAKILYLSGHGTDLIRYSVHKLSYHRNDDAVFIGKSSIELLPLQEDAVFKQIIQKSLALKVVRKKNELVKSVEEAIDAIVCYYENLFSSLEVDVKDFDKIYFGLEARAHVSHYLEYKQCSYTILENFANICNLLIPKRTLSNRVKLLKTPKEYAWFYPGEYCEAIIYQSASTRYVDDWSGLTYQYDYAECMMQLSEQDKTAILNNLNFCTEDFIGKRDLFLPMASIKSNKRFHFKHQLYVDYYCEQSEKLAIKCHPSESVSDEMMQKFMPFAEILPQNITIDTLLLIDGFEIGTLYTSGTSSIGLAGKFADRCIGVNRVLGSKRGSRREYWSRSGFYAILAPLYFAFRIIEPVVKDIQKIGCHGFYGTMLENFLDAIESKYTNCAIMKLEQGVESADLAILRFTAKPRRFVDSFAAFDLTTIAIIDIKTDDDANALVSKLKKTKKYDTILMYQITGTMTRKEHLLYDSIEDEFIVIASRKPQLARNLIAVVHKDLRNTGMKLKCSLVEEKNLSSDLATANGRIRKREQSTSWRITKPLRFIMRTLKGFKK